MVKKKNGIRREVGVYNHLWRKERSWEVASTVPLNVVVGLVEDAGTPTIILSSLQSGKQVFRLYTLTGEMRLAYTSDGSHQGVTIGLLNIPGTQKKDIAAVYTEGSDLFLHHISLTTEARLVRRVPLPMFHLRAVGAGGNLHGDDTLTYVAAGGAGESPLLVYLNTDGTIDRSFFPYTVNYRGGLQLIVADYNHDGADDAIVGPIASPQPVRVWNDRSRKLFEWPVTFMKAQKNSSLLGISGL